MFARNRYDAAKILSVLEVAIVEQFPEYRNRHEVDALSHDEIAQLPKKRVITLTIDYPCYEIDLLFSSKLEETDTDCKNLAADVLKDISVIDNQHQDNAEKKATQSPFDSEAFASHISDFVFRSRDDVAVGYVGSMVNTEFNLPLKKEDGTWYIDWQRYLAIIAERRQYLAHKVGELSS
jgi:hypothetical protein